MGLLVPWVQSAGSRVEILGDSLLVVSWLNGLWRCKYRLYNARVRMARHSLQQLQEESGVRPRTDTADWGRHIYRELNTEADILANRHEDSRHMETNLQDFKCYRLFFDGSVTKTKAGGGWVLYGATQVAQDSQEEWNRIAAVSFPMPPNSTITACELEACLWGVSFIASLFVSESQAAVNLQTWQAQHIKGIRTLMLANMIQ